MVFNYLDIKNRFLRDQPFVPVQIVTTTGKTYEIYHPDLVMVGGNFIIVGSPRSDEPTVFDQVIRIPLVHLTELRDLPVPYAAVSSSDPE